MSVDRVSLGSGSERRSSAGGRVTRDHPYRRADGTLDVAAYCRWLDDRSNTVASTRPNPIAVSPGRPS